MPRVSFLALGQAGAFEGIAALELENGWRLVIFHSVDQGITALREARISRDELAYWEPRIRQSRFQPGVVRPPITINGTAAYLVGILLTQLNGQMIPLPLDQKGLTQRLAIFRVPVRESSATDGMMGVRGEDETFSVFHSRLQAAELLRKHHSWLGEASYAQHEEEVEASPLPADSKTSVLEVTGYPAWLINEVLERYERARKNHERRRLSVN